MKQQDWRREDIIRALARQKLIFTKLIWQRVGEWITRYTLRYNDI